MEIKFKSKKIYLNNEETRYEINAIGQVKNTETGKIRKLALDKDGYYKLDLYHNGKCYNKRVNRLVAETFIFNPNNFPEVDHINCNKTDNIISNLEWVTTKENKRRAIENGLCNSMMGENNWNNKYKKEDILKVISLLNGNYTIREISNMTGVSIYTIKDICYKRAWKYLTSNLNLNYKRVKNL